MPTKRIQDCLINTKLSIYFALLYTENLFCVVNSIWLVSFSQRLGQQEHTTQQELSSSAHLAAIWQVIQEYLLLNYIIRAALALIFTPPTLSGHHRQKLQIRGKLVLTPVSFDHCVFKDATQDTKTLADASHMPTDI